MSKNVEHSSEKTPRELTWRDLYKFHTSVISTHFFDQVQIFFVFCTLHYYYGYTRNQLLILEHTGTWAGLGKEDLDDNFHQLLLRDSENH